MGNNIKVLGCKDMLRKVVKQNNLVLLDEIRRQEEVELQSMSGVN